MMRREFRNELKTGLSSAGLCEKLYVARISYLAHIFVRLLSWTRDKTSSTSATLAHRYTIVSSDGFEILQHPSRRKVAILWTLLKQMQHQIGKLVVD